VSNGAGISNLVLEYNSGASKIFVEDGKISLVAFIVDSFTVSVTESVVGISAGNIGIAISGDEEELETGTTVAEFNDE
jgi:hypothetical protein